MPIQLRAMPKRIIAAMFFFAVVALSVSAQTTELQTQVRYLSGTGKDDTVMWDFLCSSGRGQGAWTRIPVPSCWEQQGFGGYNYGRDRISDANPLANEQGKYRLQFEVPASWRGKIVRLVFDGSMTDTEARVNGQS